MDLKTEGVIFSYTASSNTWRDSSESPVISAESSWPGVILGQKAQRE